MPTFTSSSSPERVVFPQGLPGFPGGLAYCIEQVPESGRFMRLRSEAEGGPTFVVMLQDADDTLIDADDIAEACAELGFSPCEAATLLVVTVSRTPAGWTLSVNRRAPIIIDTRRQLAYQVVLPQTHYPVRHALAA
jgi:flagellar assembly factor FliW